MLMRYADSADSGQMNCHTHTAPRPGRLLRLPLALNDLRDMSHQRKCRVTIFARGIVFSDSFCRASMVYARRQLRAAQRAVMRVHERSAGEEQHMSIPRRDYRRLPACPPARLPTPARPSPSFALPFLSPSFSLFLLSRCAF